MTTTTAEDDENTSTTSDGWKTEIELRRFARSRASEADKNNNSYVAAPDPARAEEFDPDDTHKDYCNNQALRQMEGLEVYSNRLVIPLSTVKQLEYHEDGTSEFEEYAWQVMRNMRIDEFEGSHGTKWACHNPVSDFDNGETRDVDKTDPRPIYVRLPQHHAFNRLQNLYEERKEDGRTLLVVIVARDAATGTGKTTLAVQLAKSWDTHGWTADRATLDPGEYANKYTDEDTPPKSVLILDEAEQAADNRRSMSNQNVKLSHLWATMRFREIYSIITLPSASMLDKRLQELADVKIVVHNRGTAAAYKTKIDDHTGEYRAKRLCRIRWDPLDEDPEYQKLTDKKAERMANYAETFSYGDDDDGDAPTPDEIRRDYRLQVIERMSAAGHTQEEIADALPDISDRSTVSKILNR